MNFFRKSFIPEMRYPRCRHRGIASEIKVLKGRLAASTTIIMGMGFMCALLAETIFFGLRINLILGLVGQVSVSP